jgi:hypothetical protein
MQSAVAVREGVTNAVDKLVGIVVLVVLVKAPGVKEKTD